ncbi:Crp/Fnr family transcriptional regulator [Sutcliffiella halmapala]|uniref:Crp/Fnr family transcriptional regulator n=1 Tax=Sutcliffiella halmapala TaxID=79882 RepID=UPI0009949F1D|nr:Crp/Fnr family transcriptional regulator [Sutcliffiella halmapala]
MTDKIEKELKDFLFSSFKTKLEVKKGSYLYQEGSEATALFVIITGKIQMSKITPDGQELTLRLCSKDDIIGELSLFCAGALYMQNAKVVENAQVLVIEKELLEQRLSENSQLALVFMKWMGLQFRRTQTKFRDLVLNGKKGALYSTLIRMTNSYGVMKENGILINTPLTNQDLANYCGSSREVVNRMLSDLKKRNILTIAKGKITIHNLEFLKLEINCENCPIDLCRID